MFRTYLICSLNFAVFAFQVDSSAQTVDDLIQRYIQSRGGYDKIKSVESMKMRGYSSGGQSDGPVTIFVKRPSSWRTESNIQGQQSVSAYDGETAWQTVGVGEPTEIPQRDLGVFMPRTVIDGPLIDYKTKGHQITLDGKERVRDRDAYRLKVILKNGHEYYSFLDAETYLELKMIENETMEKFGFEMTVESFFRDYKNIQGLFIPHVIETGVNWQFYSQRGARVVVLTIEEVEINPLIDNVLFKRSRIAEKLQEPQQLQTNVPKTENSLEGQTITKYLINDANWSSYEHILSNKYPLLYILPVNLLDKQPVSEETTTQGMEYIRKLIFQCPLGVENYDLINVVGTWLKKASSYSKVANFEMAFAGNYFRNFITNLPIITSHDSASAVLETFFVLLYKTNCEKIDEEVIEYRKAVINMLVDNDFMTLLAQIQEKETNEDLKNYIDGFLSKR